MIKPRRCWRSGLRFSVSGIILWDGLGELSRLEGGLGRGRRGEMGWIEMSWDEMKSDGENGGDDQESDSGCVS